jgi:hypothetical protein
MTTAIQNEFNASRIPTDIDFYDKRPPLKESAVRLLSEYSRIPNEEIQGHVGAIVSIQLARILIEQS